MLDQPTNVPPVASREPEAIPLAPTSGAAFTETDPRFRKRLWQAADRLLASALILFTLPLAVFIALAVKLDSRGPVVISERRLNANGRWYRSFRFRTAVAGPEAASLWEWRGRVTRVGAFLRYSRIEELPQLLNVLCGEMTLFGMPGMPRAFDS